MTTIKKAYAIYGASGLGREIMPFGRAFLQKNHLCMENFYFIDDAVESGTIINGNRVISYDEFITLNVDEKHVAVAIADSRARQKISEKLTHDGCVFWNIKADNVDIFDEVSIEDGYTMTSFVTISSNISIGKGFQVNAYSFVGHDCIIGDYVTFSPRVSCNGNIHIHDHAYLGTGAIIRQGTPDKPLIIGEGAIVGMGAVVTKDVPAGAVVVGNPAKQIQKK